MSTDVDEEIILDVDISASLPCEAVVHDTKCGRPASYRLVVTCPSCGTNTEFECQFHKQELDRVTTIAKLYHAEAVFECKMCDAEVKIRWERL